MPKRNKPLRPVNRFTLTMASQDDVEKGASSAFRDFLSRSNPIDSGAFLFADLDRNWWEVRS